MTNEIYERDYTKCASKYLPIGDIESSPLKYLDLDNTPTVPHVMLPHAREKYEECLRLMNRFAAKYCGNIRAQFNRETHTSVIRVELPTLFFEGIEDNDLLYCISKYAKQVTVTREKRGLALFVRVHCFTPMALQGFDEQI